MKLMRILTESLAWLQIVASPLLIGAAIGAILSSYCENILLLWIFAGIGLVSGIILATRIKKKIGAVEFM